MEVIRMPVGVYAANCYIVYDSESKRGVIIDPGGSPDKIIREVEDMGLEIESIILTHGHGDHIGGVEGVRQHFKVPVWVHEEDEKLLESEELNLSITMPIEPVSIKADRTFVDGDKIAFDGKEIKVIHTPGHSPGGTTFDIEGKLFTGDTLFAGSVGRSDFIYSDGEALIEGIKTKLLVYEGDTEIYPGHGNSSTLKAEKRYNPFIKE